MSFAIDVSNNNGVIDWDKTYVAGVRTGWAKATEGLSFLDGYLCRNLAAMRRLKIHDGYYHFARPAEDATRQADWYVDSVLRVGGFGVKEPVLDIEDAGGLNKAKLTAWMLMWLARVERRTGRVPAIYCSTSFAEECFDCQKFPRYPLWLASYGVSSPRVPAGWTSWTYWQYTDKGRIDGINGDVDLDYLRGEVKALMILMQGSTGDAVKTLQEQLKKALGLGSSFAVDGQYGPATAAAVKSFQLQQRLTVDGIAGKQTLSALANVVHSIDQAKADGEKTAEAKSTPAPAQSSAPTGQVSVDRAQLEVLATQLKTILASVKTLLEGN